MGAGAGDAGGVPEPDHAIGAGSPGGGPGARDSRGSLGELLALAWLLGVVALFGWTHASLYFRALLALFS